jgi:putative ABC transport system permease protein
MVGALVGLWIAALAIKSLFSIAPVETPGIEPANLNPIVVTYAVAVAFLTAILFGLLPALGISSPQLNDSLKESSRSSTEAGCAGKIRRALVSAEFALALVLVVGAGLMLRILFYMHQIDLGFQPDHVISMRVPFNDVKYNEQQQADFHSTLLERLSATPGVRCATVSRGIPIFGWSGQGFVTEENPHPLPADMPDANYLAVGPWYFDVLRIPLMKGRVLTEHDNGSSLHVAVVNEALARSRWPGQNPIGKRLKLSWATAGWWTVVGVTGNMRTQGPEAPSQPEIYVPYTQHPWLITPRTGTCRPMHQASRSSKEHLTATGSFKSDIWWGCAERISGERLE